MKEIIYRRHRPEDRDASFAMFRSSVFDYVKQIGRAAPDAIDDVPAAWERQGTMMVHLENTAAEDWVAERDGRIVGLARATNRDGHIQLTHFFVDPSTQGMGVGRGLLERAIPLGLGEHRSIMATQNPLALGLYFRFGVEFQAQSFELAGTPQPRDPIGEVKIEPSDITDDIVSMDAETLGFERRTDLEFLVHDRPLYLAKVNGEIVGYAFGSNGTSTGPAAVVDPALLPGLLAAIDTEAAVSGHESVRYTLPGPAAAGIRWALGVGYRIDPFYEVLLADSPRIRLDRYVMTQPSFIW